MGKLVSGADHETFEGIFGIELNAALGARGHESSSRRIRGRVIWLRLSLCRLLTDDERNVHTPATLGRRYRFREQIVIMLPEPIPEKLVRNGEIGGRLFNPVQHHRGEPSFIDLFRHLLLNVLQRLIPHLIHLFISITYKCSQAYTQVWTNT